MNKTLTVFVCLLVFGYSLKIHTQALPATTTTTTTTTGGSSSPSSVGDDKSEEAQQAYGRLLTFISNDASLIKGLTGNRKPNQKQIMKLVKFMVDDPYFQIQLIGAISAGQGNQWLTKLSKEAQVRFLKIITSISPSQYDNSKKMNQIIQQLKADAEIGPALTKQFGNDLNASVITNVKDSLRPSVSHHFAIAVAHV